MHERRQKSRVEQDDTPFCLFPAHVAMCISIFLGLFFLCPFSSRFQSLASLGSTIMRKAVELVDQISRACRWNVLAYAIEPLRSRKFRIFSRRRYNRRFPSTGLVIRPHWPLNSRWRESEARFETCSQRYASLNLDRFFSKSIGGCTSSPFFWSCMPTHMASVYPVPAMGARHAC